MSEARIRPIVIYPFVQPKDLSESGILFEKLKDLMDQGHSQRPVTVINNQTKYRSLADTQLRSLY